MSLRRTKSQGHLETYITNDLNKYMDETSANRIERVLGKKYAGSVRLYKFPIEKCKEIKAYKVLEENKSEETKRILKEIKDKKKSEFNHLVSTFSVLPEKDIDFNSLAIISHKLAEKFARDSGDFKVGPLKDTELVEFHTYATTHSERHLGLLDKHIDDEGAVSYNTITMIWYLIKDKEVDGGNIIFYAPQPREKSVAHWHKHHVMPPDREVKINLWEQMGDVRENCVCLIFKGDIVHSPETMGGTGERSAIVFQFVRIDKSTESTKGGNKNAMKMMINKKNNTKKNIKTLKRCSRRAYNEGECYNFQALGCDVLNKPRTALFFKSVREREAYAKSKPGKRALSRCDRISRYSVVSATRGRKPIKARV